MLVSTSKLSYVYVDVIAKLEIYVVIEKSGLKNYCKSKVVGNIYSELSYCFHVLVHQQPQKASSCNTFII